jgi:DNA-binding response OmpR family regulator
VSEDARAGSTGFAGASERARGVDTVAKHILVVDCDSVRRWLLELLFARLGFEVTSAVDGAEAIEKIQGRPPDVVLSEVILPRLDGLHLARFIRREPAFAGIPVVLMTAGVAVDPDAVAMARNMGANTMVGDTDTHDTVVSAVRAALASGPPAGVYDAGTVEKQRTRFIEGGVRDSRLLLNDLHNGLDLSRVRQLARGWAAAGGALGLLQVSQAAYEVERLLDQPDPDGHALQVHLNELASLFSVLARAADAGVSSAVAAALAGKRFAVVGFDDAEALHLIETLEQAQAFVRILDTWPEAAQDGASPYDAFILNVRDQGVDSPLANLLARSVSPLVAVGSSGSSVEAVLNAHPAPHDFVLRPWTGSELLFRCYNVTHGPALRKPRGGRSAGGPARILIGDDDPAALALVQMTLKNYNMLCETAVNGGDLLDTAIRSKPDLVILDINMPKLDGFEVLGALKNDSRTRDIPVFVLTSRQQETDILRGFSLGAEDYVTKPFSPMELVARIKRTLRRSA